MISTTAGLVRRHPLGAYVLLAYVISITLGLLLNISLAFGLIALFGPAVAAVVVSRIWRGRAGVSELSAVTSRWRVHPAWYVAAVALPAPVDCGRRSSLDALAQPAVLHPWDAVLRKSVLGLRRVGIPVLVPPDVAVARHPQRLAGDDHARQRESGLLGRVSAG